MITHSRFSFLLMTWKFVLIFNLKTWKCNEIKIFFERLEILQATTLYDFNYYVKEQGSTSDCTCPPFHKKWPLEFKPPSMFYLGLISLQLQFISLCNIVFRVNRTLISRHFKFLKYATFNRHNLELLLLCWL